MKLRIMSDLHLEFMGDYAATFIRSLPTDCDVLVLAGDIDSHENIRKSLKAFADRFAKVVYVTGNHEHYGTTPKAIDDKRIDHIKFGRSNVHWLEKEKVEIGGRKFHGATLWFPRPEIVLQRRPDGSYERQDYRGLMSDFEHIREFEPWVYDRAEASRHFLDAAISPGDVVVTHHLPTPSLVHQKYAGSPLNRYFVHNCSDIILEREPAVWVNGHAHSSHDRMIAKTRMVCNPYGYYGHEPNPEFDPSFTVELP